MGTISATVETEGWKHRGGRWAESESLLHTEQPSTREAKTMNANLLLWTRKVLQPMWCRSPTFNLFYETSSINIHEWYITQDCVHTSRFAHSLTVQCPAGGGQRSVSLRHAVVSQQHFVCFAEWERWCTRSELSLKNSCSECESCWSWKQFWEQLLLFICKKRRQRGLRDSAIAFRFVCRILTSGFYFAALHNAVLKTAP